MRKNRKGNWKSLLCVLLLTGLMMNGTACGTREGGNGEIEGGGSADEGDMMDEMGGTFEGETTVPGSGNRTGNDGNLIGSPARVAVHDPSIFWETDGDGNPIYYVFGTHITSARSKDLANWSVFTNGYRAKGNTLYGELSENLSEPFRWAGENDSDCRGGYAVWAPDVIYNENYVNEDGSKGAYMIYFCTSSTYCRSAIAYAVSDHVDGGYTYRGTLVYSGFTETSATDSGSKIDKLWINTNIDELMAAGRIEEGFNSEWASGASYNTDYSPNAIDPAVFEDIDGRMWMCYGSWSGGIYLLEIDPATGDAIYPGKNGTTEDGRVIDKYFGIRIAGGHTISGEGPYILYDRDTGYYYLYTTYNYLDSKSGYNMRLFRSTDPTGPYLDAAGNNAVFASRGINQYSIGIKVMGNYVFSCHTNGYRSPGHCSSFIDQDGKMYLIYHTRFQRGGEAFEVRVHQQFVNEAGWPVTAVFENRGDVISGTGYENSELVGTYEFINHGTDSDGASVKTPETIVLQEDGTVSGDETGTWKETEGTYYAAIEIDGVTYQGVFFEQHDEAAESQMRMTFTAIGDNNATIWGVKVSDSTDYEGAPKESSQEPREQGAPATDLSRIEPRPVVSFTFDSEDELPLAGEAKIQDGVLYLAPNAYSYGKTYAELPDLTSYDFSEGITLTADILVWNYGSDWTSVFMLGDGKVGEDPGTYAYHFTQGFSSVTDWTGGDKVGYYGSGISHPYSWDFFSYPTGRNRWYTVTVTITDSEMITYINGVRVQRGTGDYTVIMDTFQVASHNCLGGSFFADPDFSGKMDNVAIYDRALSAEEIASLVK